VHDLREVADDGRIDSTVSPNPVFTRPARTQFEVAGVPLERHGGGITQDDSCVHRPVEISPGKVLSATWGRGTAPSTTRPMVQTSRTECPPTIRGGSRSPLRANMSWGAAAFTMVWIHRSLGVDKRRDGRSSKERSPAFPVLLGVLRDERSRAARGGGGNNAIVRAVKQRAKGRVDTCEAHAAVPGSPP